MCVLLIGFRCRGDLPLVVGANRDEARARPATGPELVATAGGPALVPRDLQAGGTWLGVRAGGLVVVITNRRDGDFDAARPSRGALCRAALEHADAAAVQRFVAGETRRARYNSFNLLVADGDRAGVSCWNGRLAHVDLEPGVHALSNEHGPGELRIPELDRLDWSRPEDELRDALRRLLADHTPRDAGGFRLCKHGERYGTVSSSLVTTTPSGPVRLDHAAGPPCTTPWTIHELQRPAP
jgi:uncharacterized protein with NRDE domain